jgi:hypothetical protein
MTLSLENHWLLLGLAGLLLVWTGSLAAMRWYARRRLLRELANQKLESEEASLDLPDLRPEDRAALEVIRATRRRYLLKLWPGTELSFRTINEMSLELVQAIARVYFPDEDRPELKASLSDLVALHNRVGARLAAWLDTFPMKAVKDVEIKTLWRVHEIYQSLREHPGYAFIKRHHLDKVVKWGWSVYNYANPWHWGRRAAYHGGKEVAARLLLARTADLVGEEAVRLYGRRFAA